MKIQLGTAATKSLALICKNIFCPCILSWQNLQALGIISVSFPLPGPAEPRTAALTNSATPFIPSPEDEAALLQCTSATARAAPQAYESESLKVTELLLEKKVIAAVSKPTKWCSPGFFVPKPGGQGRIRLVVDYKQLNQAILRRVHPFPCTNDILQAIPSSAKFFCVMDAVNGYYQIAYLTTFLFPSGRYRFLRAPQGCCASSDVWCRESDKVIRGMSFAKKLLDDILVWANTVAELQANITKILQECKAMNLTISKSKLRMGSSVRFAGHLVSSLGIKPDPDLLASIGDFPVPTDRKHVRSFLGLAVQLGNFLPDLAHNTTLLRKLTSDKNTFLWLDSHQTIPESKENSNISNVSETIRSNIRHLSRDRCIPPIWLRIRLASTSFRQLTKAHQMRIVLPNYHTE